MSEDQEASTQLGAKIGNFKESDVNMDNTNFNIEVDLNPQQADDSELVEAFDRAVKQAKEKIMEKRPDLKELQEDEESSNVSNQFHGPKKNKGKQKGRKGKHNKKQNLWASGKNCRAVFSGDGREYEAVITYIDAEAEECWVKFIGYGNKEKVSLANLKPSYGKAAVTEQKVEATSSVKGPPSELNESFFSPSSSAGSKMFPKIHSNIDPSFNFGQDVSMPPMPPPSFLSGLPVDQSDSLSTVLMAWYMAGYHTGRFEATFSNIQNKPYSKF